ncbi:GntR family transcriptional regulator [Roseomonas xinghualingensis]|uniref:GntR family transcriptional regulator n=1 Tax=Roseomonas xinghualingensis TaxID=2986475 RepID=UPI0021F1A417|nr:GntR family transcriptional regulator [Roseomonas sp. SXEYE001]MCV4206665.1 GntR family transcriptional regulator [Roseomonas sp. SXEYE001]
MDPLGSLVPVGRDNLAGRVYAELRSALMEGRMAPGQRLKIRELAAAMGVSETPVREAVMQLVRERALRMEAAKAITVAGLTLEQYLELRTIRLELEGLAAEAAALRISPAAIDELAAAHEALVAAEAAGDAPAANRANWAFHHGIHRAAQMPELLAIIEGIWLRNGPTLAHLYPHAPPTYPGRHRHLDVLDGLRARDPAATRAALAADMTEGGAGLVRRLKELEDAARLMPATP